MKQQEIEVKFFLQNKNALEEHILSLGAELVSPRVHEINLRFDKPDGELSRKSQVLRLRHDYESHLTFKGAALEGQEVNVRQEIEFEVSSFETARDFLEMLGYVTVMMYEKYRTSYKLNECMVVLDEMPFGSFAEIEAQYGARIKPLANKLGLDWERRCVDSYVMLFEKVCKNRGIQPRNLSFDDFSGMTIKAEDFGLQPADVYL